MRILTLSSLFPDASRPVFGPFVERQTMGIAAHSNVELRVVAPLGIPPFPLSLHPRYADLRDLPAEECWQGITVYRPGFSHIPGVDGRFDVACMVRRLKPLLTKLRREFPFDLIDAEFFFPDGPAAVALGRYFGVPVSIKARGADIHFWGTNRATANQVKNAGQNADGLLAVSGAIKADMVNLGMPADRILVHYTGVDLDRFQPRDRARTKTMLGIDGPLITSVGALIARKGQVILIEALPALPGATLVLIGKGEDQSALAARAAALGVSDRVVFTGSVGPDKIAEWLGAADVMALPTASEGLANAWVEALASGTPVVTCDVGGAREIIDQPVAGHLVERSPEAFAAAINSILASPPDQSAVRACAERFTWARNTEALYAHFSTLLGR